MNRRQRRPRRAVVDPRADARDHRTDDHRRLPHRAGPLASRTASPGRGSSSSRARPLLWLERRRSILDEVGASSSRSATGGRARSGAGHGAVHRHRRFDRVGRRAGRPRWTELARVASRARAGDARPVSEGPRWTPPATASSRRSTDRHERCGAPRRSSMPSVRSGSRSGAGVHTGEVETIDGKVGGLGRRDRRPRRRTGWPVGGARVPDREGSRRRLRPRLRGRRRARAEGRARAAGASTGW